MALLNSDEAIEKYGTYFRIANIETSSHMENAITQELGRPNENNSYLFDDLNTAKEILAQDIKANQARDLEAINSRLKESWLKATISKLTPFSERYAYAQYKLMQKQAQFLSHELSAPKAPTLYLLPEQIRMPVLFENGTEIFMATRRLNDKFLEAPKAVITDFAFLRLRDEKASKVDFEVFYRAQSLTAKNVEGNALTYFFSIAHDDRAASPLTTYTNREAQKSVFLNAKDAHNQLLQWQIEAKAKGREPIVIAPAP